MFLFGQIGVTYALFVCAAAIKCYRGQINVNEKGPPGHIKDCPRAKYCAKTSGGHTLYDCDDINFYCKKEGCETTEPIITCCCTSDLCNGASEPKQLSGFLSMISIIIIKLIIY
ncbi:unnamed protein product [Cylicocyclus nassatus]|uniref:Uncharacterized protein n=1 Tax=Cylicocyclus nassatus TaxID=53992 RepID=A0AA36GSD1_CYLNA|nr:unnamed protein product [Cylicocyclus nassatus]